MLIQVVKFQDGSKFSRKLPKKPLLDVNTQKSLKTFIVEKNNIIEKLFGAKNPESLIIRGDGDVFVKAPVNIKSKTTGHIKTDGAKKVRIKDAQKATVMNSTGEVKVSGTKKLAYATGNKEDVLLTNNASDAIAEFNLKTASTNYNKGEGISRFNGKKGVAAGNNRGLAKGNGEKNIANYNKKTGIALGEAECRAMGNKTNIEQQIKAENPLKAFDDLVFKFLRRDDKGLKIK